MYFRRIKLKNRNLDQLEKIKLPIFPILIFFSFLLWINHIICKPEKANIETMALWHHQLWFLHFMLTVLIISNEFYKLIKDKIEK